MQHTYILWRPHPAAAKRWRDGIFLYVSMVHLCCIFERNAFVLHFPIICMLQRCRFGGNASSICELLHDWCELFFEIVNYWMVCVIYSICVWLINWICELLCFVVWTIHILYSLFIVYVNHLVVFVSCWFSLLIYSLTLWTIEYVLWMVEHVC